MDFASARARLPSMTRERFGGKVAIMPMREGKMGPASADPDRVAQVDVAARFDLGPELEQVGGGRNNGDAARIVSPHASFSFAVADLSWMPRQGDQITHAGRTYRVDRLMETAANVVICLVSRVS